MNEELIIDASALDDTHLELDKALPEDFGQRLRVRITPLHPTQGYTLREPQATYRRELPPKFALKSCSMPKQAMIAANRFIVEHLPDRFSAGLPNWCSFHSNHSGSFRYIWSILAQVWWER